MSERERSSGGWQLRAVWPFPSAAEVERRFEQLIRARWGAGAHEPAADVYVSGGEVWVELDLPGVAPDEVAARIEGGALHVEAVRRLAPPLEWAQPSRLERSRGAIRRLVPLPAPIENAELEVVLEAGVLRVRIAPGSTR